MILYPIQIPYLIYLINYKPLDEGLRIEIFNEWIVGMHFFLMFAYSDITPSARVRYELGWIILSLFLFMFVVNVGYIIVGIRK
jgi:hypothetical protein